MVCKPEKQHREDPFWAPHEEVEELAKQLLVEEFQLRL
jgi:hypothetical protein